MDLLSHNWGATATERRLVFPCDVIISDPDDSLYRAVTIHAPPAIVFRWLCQMRAAPYSYDWIDNGGRQSPPELTAGLEGLEPGQDVMRIFDLVSFEKDRHLTLRMKPQTRAARSFGDIAVSYLIVPDERGFCRLVVKLVAQYRHGAWGGLMSALLPWGDLVMMRKQLQNFKRLAEGRVQ
jgi:hypothetical protein